MAPNLEARSQLARNNLAQATRLWPAQSSQSMLEHLRELTISFGFSVPLGELRIVDNRWYVTHSGLLRLANRRRCKGIRVEPVPQFSDPAANRWVFKSTVYTSTRSRGFVGFGDADPSNVSTLVLGAEMRIAETRAVNRALRKAYGIGLCSVEELGVPSFRPEPGGGGSRHFATGNGNGSHKNEPKLRDRLCLLIRKFELDPNQVIRYAADFCGTEVLRDAGRDLVESFITTLADEAAKDRSALICKLNSYGHVEAVKS
jgi:hypothetical protein